MNEFHYRIPWRARGQRPGHHRGTGFGSGLEFSGYAPLLRAPDPRRLDVRASIANPFGDWQVRLYRQRASIPVYLVADLSASMAFVGRRRKLDVLAEFASCAAYSVYRTGDAFGIIGCDEHVIADFLLPPTHARGAGMDIAHKLAAFEARGRNAHGLLEAVNHIGRQRALVFLASDFHFPLEFLDAVLDAFAAHHMVPVVLWDDAEFRHLPNFGLMRLVDAESGRQRTLWLRPTLRAAWRRRFAQRRAALAHCFAQRALRPFHVGQRFRAEAMTEYFLGGDAGAQV